MKKKCPQCKLVNYPTAQLCVRCGSALMRLQPSESRGNALPTVLRRVAICLAACVAAVAGFYISLVLSAKPMDAEQKESIKTAIELLENKGFTKEVFLLRRVAIFRASDNWLNASVVKEDAFAATNFPFAIITVYPDFFTYPGDDVERAAILLHEAMHLQGADEKEAYEFVWRNRAKLGWTSDAYAHSTTWIEIRKQTSDYVPGLFICDFNPFGDCTENRPL